MRQQKDKKEHFQVTLWRSSKKLHCVLFIFIEGHCPLYCGDFFNFFRACPNFPARKTCTSRSSLPIMSSEKLSLKWSRNRDGELSWEMGSSSYVHLIYELWERDGRTHTHTTCVFSSLLNLLFFLSTKVSCVMSTENYALLLLFFHYLLASLRLIAQLREKNWDFLIENVLWIFCQARFVTILKFLVFLTTFLYLNYVILLKFLVL